MVYIVDDHVATAQMLSACLERAGYAVSVFEESVEALSAFASAPTKPRLLIADFFMPAMDGLELMRRCKDLQPGLKVIILSGTLAKELMWASALGVDTVLEKPVSLSKLLGVVESLIGKGRT